MTRRSIFKQQGYIINDNRCSGGVLEEDDILGCSHCQKLMKRPQWQADGGFCHSCDAPLCGPCATRAMKDGCTVFLKTLESALEAQYRKEQYAKIAGNDLADPNTGT
jgi:hypothetical protein